MYVSERYHSKTSQISNTNNREVDQAHIKLKIRKIKKRMFNDVLEMTGR